MPLVLMICLPQVLVLLLMDTVRNILNIQSTWMYAIKAHEHIFLILQAFNGASIAAVWLGDLIILVVQGFFIYRIWQLMPLKQLRLTLTTIAYFIEVVSFGAAIGVIYELAHLSLDLDAPRRQMTPPLLQLSCAVIIDLYIAMSLIFIMAKSQTAFKSTGMILTRLLRYSIERGVLLFLTQLGFFIIFVFGNLRKEELAASIFYAAGTLYMNTLLALLNLRKNSQYPSSIGAHESFRIPTEV
ncbi:hypothetical protein C8Q72DRAFT_501574 [Fomitopsis betulina]|nr:hypothetical protein C8Q72DRAFT_501574 [Fomitopsis betulina]